MHEELGIGAKECGTIKMFQHGPTGYFHDGGPTGTHCVFARSPGSLVPARGTVTSLDVLPHPLNPHLTTTATSPNHPLPGLRTSTTMSLQDLTQYAGDQTDRINLLLQEGSLAPGSASRKWTAFWESAWKKDFETLEEKELVVREQPGDRVEDYSPSDPVPSSTSVMKIPRTLPNLWFRSSERILVRSEYYEAERAALSASENGRDALVVAGHPGIGSLSSCLITCRI